MKAQGRGDVEIGIGMMHTMQAPQPRHGMKDAVLEVDDQVQQPVPAVLLIITL